MPPRQTPARTVVQDFPTPQPDATSLAIQEHAEAMRSVGEALSQVAAEIRAATAQREPVDKFFDGATMRLDKLCQFLGKKGPWLLGSVPVVLVSINAISPQAGKALAAFLKAAGVAP